MDSVQLQAKLGDRQPIEGARFAGVDWCDLDCEYATFTDCVIEKAQLTNVNFAGARFMRCQFPRCRFARSDLSDATFEECIFTVRDDSPAGCSFMFCDLRRTQFLKCDLSLCQIERSDLYSVEMDQCNLRGARFHKADFSHA